MPFRNLRRAAKAGSAITKTDWGKHLKRAALLGAIGTAAAGIGVGVGVGLAGWALWRKLGMKAADVKDHVVLITGSSRGLGFAMAQEFAKQGARLVICARDERELKIAEERLHAFGTEVLAVRCDVAVHDEVVSMIQQANDRFGRIDILVNNAGIISVGPLESQTLTDFQEAMDVMFWGVVYPTLAVLPQMMRRRGGHIANITSIGGKVAVPHLLPYDCAKFAAVGFSEGLRAEALKDGVKVTTVCPGLMRTGSHLNAEFKGDHRAEYTWFSLGATSPLTAMDAHRAARNIVNAIRRGRAEIILTPQAKLLALFHGVFPGLTSDILGQSNRLMPTAVMGEGQERRKGNESETAVTRSFATELGRRAAAALNQYPEGRAKPA
jgi:short-subunit dehydrogenase